MQLKLPTWLAAILWLAIPGIYALLLLGNKLDSLYPFIIYLICAAVSWIMCGVSYGVLPSVKTFRELQQQAKIGSRPEPGADSNAEKAFGYVKWYACCIILPLIITIAYHFQLAGYF